MKSAHNEETLNTKRRPFLSLRFKMMGAYILLIVSMLVAIVSVLPNIFEEYFLNEKEKELEKTRQIIDEILTERDFRTDETANVALHTVADALDINIWICVPVDETTVRIYDFGNTTNGVENLDFSELSVNEKSIVQQVVEGAELIYSMNTFPTAFLGQTISLGYQQRSLEVRTIMFDTQSQEVPFMQDGALFLHIALDDISVMTSTVFQMVLITFGLIALAAMLTTFFMSNNILLPVKQMKDAAEAITKGDFSQEIQRTSYDEIGELAHSFNVMAKELQAVDTLQSDFIANISHDFRSPLTSIKGYVEAMLDGTIPEEQFSKYLNIVLGEANRLTKMTNNVLDLTKMENGQIELNPTNFDINEMIVQLALSLEGRIEEKKIQMSFQFLQEKLFVTADLDLIQRVVYNLLDNALKFTEEGDSISVETSVVGRKAHVVIADTGIGISEESLPHVFERFHKGDKSRGQNKLGAGLGLAIVKQIMLTHHEDITVHSKEGEGTEFTFTLPLAYRYNLVEKK